MLDRLLRGRRLIVFLDFDGTLAPIRRSPKAAFLSAGRKRVLKTVAHAHEVAVISGRSLPDIKRKVGLEGITYAADHGFFIEYRNKQLKPFVSDGFREMIRRFNILLKERLMGMQGVLLEDKGMTLTVHYRRAKKKEALKKAVIELAAGDGFRNDLVLREGKQCLEVRPNVQWDKGSAVAWLLLKMAKGKRPALPVYIGDDTTDEDVFRALKDSGITIRVGKAGGSGARFYVKNTTEVFRSLRYINKKSL